MRPMFDIHDDSGPEGLVSATKRLDFLIQRLYPHIWSRFQSEGISSTFFAVSWITSLFTQQINGPDLERLWDTLLVYMFLMPQQIL